MSEQVITAGESMKCQKCGGYLWPGVAGYAHQCPDAPTEMTSLREIKAKLDGLTAVSSKLVGLLAEDLGEVRNRLSKTNERLDYLSSSLATLFGAVDAIAESQGKLLAAMNEITDWAKGTNAVIAAKLYRKPKRKRKKGKRR